MAKKAWNGRGGLVEGVGVRFTSHVGQIRRVKKPHPWPSPAADLKKEEAERAAAEAAEQEASDADEG